MARPADPERIFHARKGAGTFSHDFADLKHDLEGAIYPW
jgi:hypothetical protein